MTVLGLRVQVKYQLCHSLNLNEIIYRINMHKQRCHKVCLIWQLNAAFCYAGKCHDARFGN